MRIIKPYYVHRDKPMKKKDFKKELFETDNLFLYPLLMHSFFNIRGKNKWIFKGVADLTKEDKINPDYLSLRNHRSLEEIKREAEHPKYGCGIIRNFQAKPIYTRDIDAIKHLGK